MNPYEDKYLRDKVSRMIARQKEGKIVIAAYRDGTGLPTREELGGILGRAAYPYDYSVGDFGFLKYENEIGAYIFTAKPGAKLPEVLAQYKPLSLSKATLDVKKRQIKIQNGETLITLTGVEAWKGLHNVLGEINEELARVNAGVLIWKITPQAEASSEPIQHLFLEAVPRLRNGQAMAHVSGYAFDQDHILAYIGLVGYKTSLESLRVTLLTSKSLSMIREGTSDVTLNPTDKYEQAWQAMPEYTSHHAAFLSRFAIPGKWEPEDLAAYLLAFRETVDAGAELIRQFIERLKEALEIPILDEWAAVLWKHACDRKYVQEITTGGDCIRGVRVNLQAEWRELLTDLLSQGAISLTK